MTNEGSSIALVKEFASPIGIPNYQNSRVFFGNLVMEDSKTAGAKADARAA